MVDFWVVGAIGGYYCLGSVLGLWGWVHSDVIGKRFHWGKRMGCFEML